MGIWMHKKIITANEAGQRLDKFLNKYLPEAGNGFIYKMLRKKNITLNGKKANGSEKILLGDAVQFFISEETIDKLRSIPDDVQNYHEAFDRLKKMPVLFENEHLLAVEKPAGLLCQKAKADDISLNEWLLGYLLSIDAIDGESLKTFRPSVLNRLDRNTGGIVLCGKTLACSQEISHLLKEKRLKKIYHLIVKGKITEAGELRGHHEKDEGKNKVKIKAERLDAAGKTPVITKYRPLQATSGHSLIEAELITGKSHQIRAHFAAIGHPLIGDYKYGDRRLNDYYKRAYGVESQLLHAVQVLFPVMEKPFDDLSELAVISEPPDLFREIMSGLYTGTPQIKREYQE